MEIWYVQTVPDGKCLCPDFRAFKFYMRSTVVQKSPISRLLCVQNCLCSAFHAFQTEIHALQN